MQIHLVFHGSLLKPHKLYIISGQNQPSPHPPCASLQLEHVSHTHHSVFCSEYSTQFLGFVRLRRTMTICQTHNRNMLKTQANCVLYTQTRYAAHNLYMCCMPLLF